MSSNPFFVIHAEGSGGFIPMSRPKKNDLIIRDCVCRIKATMAMAKPGSFKWNAVQHARRILSMDERDNKSVTASERGIALQCLERFA